MPIVITEDCKPLLPGETERREFAAGERHDLLSAHEERLIALGHAERFYEEPVVDKGGAKPAQKAINPVEEKKVIEPAVENKAERIAKRKAR